MHNESPILQMTQLLIYIAYIHFILRILILCSENAPCSCNRFRIDVGLSRNGYEDTEAYAPRPGEGGSRSYRLSTVQLSPGPDGTGAFYYHSG